MRVTEALYRDLLKLSNAENVSVVLKDGGPLLVLPSNSEYTFLIVDRDEYNDFMEMRPDIS